MSSPRVAGLGPHGEFAAPVDELQLTDEMAARARQGVFRVAVVIHTTSSDWSRQQLEGISQRLVQFGAEVAEVVDYDFSVERQVQALERLARQRPHAVISIPVDNVRTAEAHRSVARAGVRLVLMDNAPIGLVARKDYVTVVSADNFGNGEVAAELLAAHVPPGGVVGIVGFGVGFYVTNEREIAFRKWLKEHRPDVVLRHAVFGHTDEAGQVARSLVEAGPTPDGLFVVWDVPAMAVVRSLRDLGRDIPVTTIDLGSEAAIELARDGLIKGIGAQQPFDLGVAEATATIMALVGAEPPPWVALPALPVTRANILDAYTRVWHRPVPEELQRAFEDGSPE